jgi:hypothetical protein
MLQMLL